MAVTVNRTTISEWLQPEGKTSWRTRGFSDTKASAGPPRGPATGEGGQVHVAAAAQVQGWGRGGLQDAPEQRRLRGPGPRSPAASRRDGGGLARAFGGSDAVHLREINSSHPSEGILPFLFGSPKQMHFQVLRISGSPASARGGGPSRACAPSVARAAQKLSALCHVSLPAVPPSGAPAPSLPRLLSSLGWKWNFPPLPYFAISFSPVTWAALCPHSLPASLFFGVRASPAPFLQAPPP